MNYSHLILRKICKFVATRYQILRLKCTKFNLWSTTQTPLGELACGPPDLTGFKGPTSNGGVGSGRVEFWETEGEEKKGDPQGLVHTHKFEIVKNTPGIWNVQFLVP